MSDNSSLEKKKYLKELVTNQLKTVPLNRRLIYKDLARITKYIESSIFDDNKCCIFKGYVTNAKNPKKGTYINFFFRNKKVAFHRLLYENFVGSLGDDYYIKFTCEDEDNKGKCCNVNHMLKYKYNSNNENDEVLTCNNCTNEINETNQTIQTDQINENKICDDIKKNNDVEQNKKNHQKNNKKLEVEKTLTITFD